MTQNIAPTAVTASTLSLSSWDEEATRQGNMQRFIMFEEAGPDSEGIWGNRNDESTLSNYGMLPKSPSAPGTKGGAYS